MTADEAAQALGISITTLYAYVSRKQLRSEKIEGSRARRYWKADIDRLRGLEPVLQGAPRDAAISTKTTITLITESGLFFRGHDAIELSTSSSLESLAALLWQVPEEELFGGKAPAVPGIVLRIGEQLAGCSLFERCQALFPLIESANPQAYDLSSTGYARTGADVLRWLAALVTRALSPSTLPIHQQLAKKLRAPAGFDEVIRTLLVLSADHEFDPLTYAVRAMANVGVTPFQAVSAGLIAAQGQRFSAERYGSCARFLQEILTGKDGAAAVIGRLRSGQPLSGFGAPRSQADPRAVAMMNILRQAIPADTGFKRLLDAQKAALDATAAPIDFILPALFVGHHLGLVGDELAITALGRAVGMVAHAMEQYQQNELLRPRALYVGRLP
jgi:citrate synthase